MVGRSPLHLLLGPAAPATGVGGRPGPGSALGPPPSRQRPPWGCWAWWWWLEGVEPPVTGLYGLHTLVIPELVPHARSPCPGGDFSDAGCNKGHCHQKSNRTAPPDEWAWLLGQLQGTAPACTGAHSHRRARGLRTPGEKRGTAIKKATKLPLQRQGIRFMSNCDLILDFLYF